MTAGRFPADCAALLAMPISNRTEGEAFIEALHNLGLMYHFDDDAVDCLHGTTVDGAPLTSESDARAIGLKVSACYDAWEASGADMRHDCPIGHALKAMGHDMDHGEGGEA